jgi:hypothetical protein
MDQKQELVNQILDLNLVGAVISNELDRKFFEAKKDGYKNTKDYVVKTIRESKEFDVAVMKCSNYVNNMKLVLTTNENHSVEERGEIEGKLVSAVDISGVLNTWSNKIAAAKIKS